MQLTKINNLYVYLFRKMDSIELFMYSIKNASIDTLGFLFIYVNMFTGISHAFTALVALKFSMILKWNLLGNSA